MNIIRKIFYKSATTQIVFGCLLGFPLFLCVCVCVCVCVLID